MISSREGPPKREFRWAATAVTGFVTLYVAGAFVVGYDGGDHEQFREGQAVDTMTALFHGMTATLAGMCLLLTPRELRRGCAGSRVC